MRAVVFDGKVQFHPNRPDPKPCEGEALVRVHLAGICATDLHITQGYMNFSGVLGHEMVGTVVEGSPAWKGKRVVSEINCVCRTCEMCQSGFSNHCLNRTVMGIAGRDGCFADLVAVPERNLHEVPEVITDEEAVFVEPLAAAYQVLAQCPIDSRMTVSVVGSGRLGILIAQVLAATGCKLTVIGRNEKKLLLCEKKGVQAIHLRDLIPRKDRHVVVECTGSPDGLRLAMQLVKPRGTIILKSTYANAVLRTESATGQRLGSASLPESRSGSGAGSVNLAPLVIDEVTLLGSRCGPFPEAINALARQAVEVRSMISKTYPIEETQEAFQAAQDSQNIKVLLKINLT